MYPSGRGERNAGGCCGKWLRLRPKRRAVTQTSGPFCSTSNFLRKEEGGNAAKVQCGSEPTTLASVGIVIAPNGKGTVAVETGAAAVHLVCLQEACSSQHVFHSGSSGFGQGSFRGTTWEGHRTQSR